MTSQPPVPEPGATPAPGQPAPDDARQHDARQHDARPYDARPYDARPYEAGGTGLPPDDREAPPRPAGDVPAAPVDPAGVLPQHQIGRTRTGGLWVAVAAAALVLLFLLIFILQNSQQVQVSFFGADGDLALGVALLLSAVAGALLVVLVGTARIVQLRLVARRHRARDAAALDGGPDRPARRRLGRR
jgi:uncharacterized integral membrane protein